MSVRFGCEGFPLSPDGVRPGTGEVYRSGDFEIERRKSLQPSSIEIGTNLMMAMLRRIALPTIPI